MVSSHKKTIIAGSIFFLSILVLSLTLYFVLQGGTTRRVLFFPHIGTRQIVGDFRNFTLGGDDERDVASLVRELFLGPSLIHSDRFVPKETGLNAVLYRNGRLYVDIDRGFVDSENRTDTPIDEIIAILEYNIRFNFPKMDDIAITVDGLPIE